MKMKQIILLIFVFATMMCSCGSASERSDKSAEPVQEIIIPLFDADSAYSYVAQQVAFGYRIPGSEAHKKTAEWLCAEMERHHATVIKQETVVTAFDGTKLPICNIIAQYAPEKNNRILLAAHWDSRPYADHDPNPENHRKPIDGANDGASGVGVLLEIARHLGEQAPILGVDIILFDAEDYGSPTWNNVASTDDTWALGSEYWSENLHTPGYRARYGILLDMVGAKGACFYREAFSHRYASHILDKVWQCATRLGYASTFINEQAGAITDDHLYMNRVGIPSIDIIHIDPNSGTGFFPQWHTVGDNMAQIDPYTLGVVGQTVLTVIYEEE